MSTEIDQSSIDMAVAVQLNACDHLLLTHQMSNRANLTESDILDRGAALTRSFAFEPTISRTGITFPTDHSLPSSPITGWRIYQNRIELNL